MGAVFQAWRDLRRRPGYGLSTSGLLALGLGAAFAIFSVFDAVLLRPLPFHGPDRLVQLTETSPLPDRRHRAVSAGTAADLMNDARSFVAVAGSERIGGLSIARGDHSNVVRASYITWNFFDTLGVRPVLGRPFTTEYEISVVISHDAWQTWLGGRPDVIGSVVELHPYGRREVIGVMPEGFAYPSGTEVWFATQVLRPRGTGEWRGAGPPRSERTWSLVGRLRPGVDATQATAELEVLASRIAAAHPDTNGGWSAAARGLERAVIEPVQPILTAVALCCVLLLVMTFANSLNLAHARAWMRRRDVAVRTALGATSGHLFRQVLSERLLIAGAGAPVGIVAGAWLLAWLRTSGAAIVPRVAEVQTRASVIGLALLAAGLLALLEAVILTQPGRRQPERTLAAGAHGRLAMNRPVHTHGLIVVQVAMSMVLLVIASSAVLSVHEFRTRERGFEPRSLATLQLTRGSRQPPELILDTATQIPFVLEAALVSDAVFSGETWSINAVSTYPPPGRTVSAGYSIVSDDYFHTLRIPLIAGRAFDVRDLRSPGSDDVEPTATSQAGAAQPDTANSTVIVNRTLALEVFGREDPIGERVAVDDRWVATIVGVVADAQVFPGAPVRSEMYRSFGQDGGGSHLTLVLRERFLHSRPFAQPRVVARLQQALPGLAFANYQTAHDLIDREIPAERLASELLRVFAAIALMVSLVGLGVIVALVVRSSRRTLAIRSVLGARSADIVGLVCRPAAWSLGLGLAGGLGVSQLIGRALIAQGYWSSQPPGWIGVMAAALFIGGAALAALVPTLEALRTDPAAVLRSDP